MFRSLMLVVIILAVRPSLNQSDLDAAGTCGTALTTAQQTQVNTALVALANSGPQGALTAATIQAKLDAGNLQIGSLNAPNTRKGESDGDTMLLNFKGSDGLLDLQSVMQHELWHINHGEDGGLTTCQECLNYIDQAQWIAAASCDTVPMVRCAVVHQYRKQALVFAKMCLQESGFTVNFPQWTVACCN